MTVQPITAADTLGGTGPALRAQVVEGQVGVQQASLTSHTRGTHQQTSESAAYGSSHLTCKKYRADKIHQGHILQKGCLVTYQTGLIALLQSLGQRKEKTVGNRLSSTHPATDLPM